MAPDPLRWLYRRLGPRYPRRALATQLLAAHVVVAGGVAALLLYQEMTLGEFLALIAFEELLMAVETALIYRVGTRMLRPADAWLHGDRTPETAAAAWRALTALPAQWTTRWAGWPVLINAVPFCAFTTWLLGLPWYSFWPLLAGGCVLILYGLFLRYFTAELALRPVVEEVAGGLPDDFDLGSDGVSLRYRLLVALPLLNVITGVIVAGLSQDGNVIADLGIDVLVAVAVAFTISFELSLLLTRSIVAPIDDLRRATERVARGDLDARAPVTTSDEVGALAQSFNRGIAGLSERQRLREAFGAYVHPDVAERVLTEGPALAGEEVEVTLLFLDIRDFTAMAEQLSARQVVARLNGLFEIVVPILNRHGGHANKYVGDGLLAVFGAPEPVPDHADRAVAAAREIIAAVHEYGPADIGIGIGVNSGTVLAGTIGGGGRVEFTVIGDPVNTACRVEEATRVSGDELLITDATLRRLSHGAEELEPRPEIPLRGKADDVALFAPKETSARRDGLSRPAGPQPQATR